MFHLAERLWHPMNDPSMATAAPTDRLLLGLLGAGIARSLSPALHETEGALHGLRVHYQRIDLGLAAGGAAAVSLPPLIDALRVIGFDGFNVTYPCKQRVLPLLDAVDDEAQAIGAVNTVVRRGDRLVGHNTDASGWAWGFRRALPDVDLGRVLLLGAGGAGCAAAHAALAMGVGELLVHDVDERQAAALVAALQSRHGRARAALASEPGPALASACGLIHATPTGMASVPGLPVPAAMLRASMWVSEIVYVPIETALLRAAREAGCAVADGGGMAVGQAVGAFRLFTGREPDADRMDRHLRAMLAARGPD